MAFNNLITLDRLATFLSKLRQTFAPIVHSHSASDISSGSLPIARGGTGSTSASDARTALGAAASSHTHNYLPLTGGTLTGGILENGGTYKISNDRFDISSAPSSAKYLRIVESFDANNKVIGMIEQSQATDGRIGLSLSSARLIDGTMQYNQIIPYISPTGAKTYSVTDPANFRSAISAAASSHTHAASDISSGTLDAERLPTITASKGGTGRTTLTSNAVIAGNGTGQVKQIATASGALYATAANGASQFGTLPVAQGGTGGTSAADARTNLGITPANIGAAASSHTHSYLPLTGGSTTGSIGIKSAHIDRDGSNPSSAQTGNAYFLYDKDGERIGLLRADQQTDGTISVGLGAFSEKSDGSEAGNWLNLKSLKDGSKVVAVTDAAAWRTGLGVTAANIGLGGTGSNTSKSQSTDQTVATSTVVNLCSVTLAAGTWLIWGRAAFSANASGARVVGVYTSATVINTGITYGAAKAAASTSGITLLPTGPLLVTPTANTNYYLNVQQNSGASLNCTGRIEAIRIK